MGKIKFALLGLILFSLWIVGCSSTPSPEATATPPQFSAENWWQDSVFYEVFVRSFYDSNGDGVGDINGLIEKLDYLNDGNPDTTDDLGITGIWLMPVAQSPSYHGYDVTNYYQIDDEYGTNEDFLRLIDEAHARGIAVIVDLVLNHTSDQHPWFINAQNPTSGKRDWYIWDASATGQDGWHQSAGGTYYGHFWSGMPDLNYNNPDVTDEMLNVTRFWLEDMGVDGFRLDAIKYLVEDGSVIEDTPQTHQWLEKFHTFYKSVKPNAFTVGEVWSTGDVVSEYVGDEMDIAFEFDLADAMLESAVSGKKVFVERAMQKVVETYPKQEFASFLANHDQNRTRSRLLNDEQAKIAATLQLTLPGTPFIYYGEEIGMQGTKPDQNIRRPMQWTPDGGFSTGTPWHTYFEDFATRNVALQNDDSAALLSHYRQLIDLRLTHAALRTGDWLPVETDNRGVYAFLRANADETLLVLINLSHKAVSEYSLSIPAAPITDTVQPVLILGEGAPSTPALNADGGFDNYHPFDSLPPTDGFIIQFSPQ